MPGTKQLPEPGEMAPDFSLPSLRGETLRLSDFRNRSNLILVFVGQPPDPRIEDLLAGLAEGARELSEQNTRLLVVLPLNQDQPAAWASLPFTFLSDPEGKADRLFAVPTPQGFYPAIYTIDRYGEIYSADRLLPGKLIPRPEDLFDILQFIEFQCPE
ncbi:MAG: peroxiredoxin family protein [Chloroflexi bacterium]|nr:peroxiredoxin family protein [Chloroflexota bacterium]